MKQAYSYNPRLAPSSEQGRGHIRQTNSELLQWRCHNNSNTNIIPLVSAVTQSRVPTIFWYWNSTTFQRLSRTLTLHFQGPILDGSLQHG